MSQKVFENRRDSLKEFDQENGRWNREERYKKYTNQKKNKRKYFQKFNQKFRRRYS